MSDSTYRSFASNTSRKSKPGQTYKSRYAYGNRRKEKPKPPNPEKVQFDFKTYQKDEDLREMTEIPEEDFNETEEKERERRKKEASKRGEEVMAFLEKEAEAIEKCMLINTCNIDIIEAWVKCSFTSNF